MLHSRLQFRKLIQEQLSSSGQFRMEIYNGRRDPTTIRRLPAIFILNLDEGNERFCEAPVILRKTFHVGVEVLVAHPHSIDDELDKITDAIESVLTADDGRFLGPSLYWFHLQSTEFSSSSRGDEVLGHARMIFRIIYDHKPQEAEVSHAV